MAMAIATLALSEIIGESAEDASIQDPDVFLRTRLRRHIQALQEPELSRTPKQQRWVEAIYKGYVKRGGTLELEELLGKFLSLLKLDDDSTGEIVVRKVSSSYMRCHMTPSGQRFRG